jgi:electron transfer flavoprotein beta subunit
MGYKIIVLIKQVPDTTAVSFEVMKKDGTLNRAALPAISNPEDMNALEMALSIKEKYGGSVFVLTMGPSSAEEILRDALYLGVDKTILLNDKCFAASDTLATSYVLSCAIRKIGTFDLIICGRQAIDGNTAQVGPQVAEKLDINQLTCVEEIKDVKNGKICLWQAIEDGRQFVESEIPVLLTATEKANIPRPPSVKKIMRYKKTNSGNGSLMEKWDAKHIDADPGLCGVSGSPTRVKKIEKVVFEKKQFKQIEQSNEGIKQLLQELIKDYMFD